ncbi:MAG: hypothetical protein Q7S73_01645 [bacterium]|nr:hypothetical protein [bacterium]
MKKYWALGILIIGTLFLFGNLNLVQAIPTITGLSYPPSDDIKNFYICPEQTGHPDVSNIHSWTSCDIGGNGKLLVPNVPDTARGNRLQWAAEVLVNAANKMVDSCRGGYIHINSGTNLQWAGLSGIAMRAYPQFNWSAGSMTRSPSRTSLIRYTNWYAGNGEINGMNMLIAPCPRLDASTSLCINNETGICNLDSNTPIIVTPGTEYKITWKSQYAESCTMTGPEDTFGSPQISEYDPANRKIISIQTQRPTAVKNNNSSDIRRYRLSCTGVLDGSVSGAPSTITRDALVYIGDIPAAPQVVSFTVSPNPINKGQKAVLKWQTSNADRVTIKNLTTQQVEQVAAIEERGKEVMPTQFTTYTLKAENTIYPLTSPSRSVTLKVLAPGTKPIPIVPGVPEIPTAPPDEASPTEAPSESAPDKVDVKVNDSDGPITVGAPANLNISWNLDRYCLAYGSWFGFKTKAGSQIVNVAKAGDYTYKLYCPGFNSTSDEVSVKVLGGGSTAGVSGTPGAPAIPFPAAEASISLDGKNFLRSVRVTQGKPVSLWLSAGYDINGDRRVSRSEDGGWSSLMSGGGRCDFNYDLKDNPIFEASVFNPQNAKECTAPLEEKVFNDPPGVYRFAVLRLVQSDGKVSNTGYVNIAIQPPPPPTGPPIVDFKINGVEGPLNLGAPASYNLTWQVSNADTCDASGSWSGSKGIAGSESLVSSIKRDFEYTLSCTGKLGTTAKTILLKVAEIPVCEFTALPKVLGQSAFINESVLSWKCQFANSCSISPSVNTSVDTFGSVRVSPAVTTKYTLNCQNLEGRASFDQEVEVR